MEGHVAATYTLIYRFLKQQSQSKAAEAVKKAAKSIVVLRDDIELKGPPLEDIIREWRQAKEKIRSDDESSSEESDSSDGEALSHPVPRDFIRAMLEGVSSESEDSSSADSSSEDTSDSESEDDGTSDEENTKKSPQKLVESDTSATLSSAGEKEVAKQLAKIVGVNDKNEDASSDSSGSDSSESATSDSSDAESSSDSSDSSDSSESSDEEEEEPTEQPPPSKTKGKQPSSSESSSSKSSSESEDEPDSESERKVDQHVAKKRKISENGAALTSQTLARQRKEKPPPKVIERFQRVKVQNMAPETLLNNGYEAKGGASNDYGERAHHDLIVTRGAGFRKEKNKKKRGSYRGGEITMANHSIKFDS